jgi:DNA-binding response OmpR family regulator
MSTPLQALQENPSPQDNPDPVPTLLVSGPISLDCQSFKVTTAEGSALLTPIEFDIFYHLMSHPGEVFSSIRLLQAVWDYPTDTGSTDLVRVHIKNIRGKIEPDPKHPVYIKTVPRRGYTMPKLPQSTQE